MVFSTSSEIKLQMSVNMWVSVRIKRNLALTLSVEVPLENMCLVHTIRSFWNDSDFILMPIITQHMFYA